jgi:branched-subunit amino acid transport protein
MAAIMYLTKPEVAESFRHLGFPDFFRIELAFAKIIAFLALMIPQVPVKIKEWAYAGIAIVYVSASIAHYSIGDAVSMIITPIIFLALLMVSNVYLHKMKNAAA